MKEKIPTVSRLLPLVEMAKAQGKRIVFTNGVFDILHIGHIRYLNQAKSLGDVLVVGVNSDDSAKRLKGQGRPIIPQDERAELVTALEAVDWVVIFDQDTAEELIWQLQPQIYVKGGDYTPDKLPETEIVEKYGGEVRILPLTREVSSSVIIQRILASFGDSR